MNVVDDAVLAALKATGLTVHDGEPPAGKAPDTVDSAVPYVSFYSGLGDEESARLAGHTTRTLVEFQTTYVGLTREQAKWAGERVRSALSARRLTVTGRKAWLCTLEESQSVRPDRSAKLPDGGRLWYGTDVYVLAVTG